jgi:carotenoid cleavage dioxygenase
MDRSSAQYSSTALGLGGDEDNPYLGVCAPVHDEFGLATASCTERRLDVVNTEFPSIKGRRTGRPCGYAYIGQIVDARTVPFDGPRRYDRLTGERQEHWFGPGRYGSEAPFAPRDGGTGEDDGYLVSFVSNVRDGRSEVPVPRADDLAAGLVARVLPPARVPLGLRATGVRADQLRAN